MESPLLHVVNSCCHNSQNNSPQSHPGSALKVNLSRRIIAQVTEDTVLSCCVSWLAYSVYNIKRTSAPKTMTFQDERVSM